MVRGALSLRDVTFSAGGSEIVRGVSLEVESGSTMAILGPSGCGKTTILRLVAGIERPDGGTIALSGVDLKSVPTHKRGIGFMFQDFALFPHLDVAGNIGFGLRHAGIPRSRRPLRIEEMLALVGLEGYGARSVDTLSGGERQRVALARTLAPEPEVLMLDEPLGSLDRVLRERLLIELRDILDQLDIPTIFVTHDQGEAFAIADRVAMMDQGKIIRTDAPHQIFSDPRTEFIARFLGLKAILAGTLSGDGSSWETAVGSWPTYGETRPRVKLLLRTDQAVGVEGPGQQVVAGVLRSSLFQGAVTRLSVETSAGRFEFELHGQAALPANGESIHLHVPLANVLDNDADY